MGFFTKKSSPKESAVLLLIGALVIWWLVSSQTKSVPHSSNTNVNTTWEGLVSEYSSNEIAFNDRYKTATFYLSGTVVRVSYAVGPNVSLTTDMGNSFDAEFFDNQSDRLKDVNPSDVIAFHCLRFNAGIGLDRCKIDSIKKASG